MLTFRARRCYLLRGWEAGRRKRADRFLLAVRLHVGLL